MSSQSTNENAGASKPETISVKYEFMSSLRRSTIGFPPKFHQLRMKLAKSFPEFAHLFQDKDQILRLLYVDDEGDEITITTNDELLAAYRLAQEAGKVLRFSIPSFDTNAPTTVEAVPAAAAAAAAAVDEPSAATQKAPLPKPYFSNESQANLPQRIVDAIIAGIPVHFGHACTSTGEAPIIGTRYERSDDPHSSLSADAYASLSDTEKAEYKTAPGPLCQAGAKCQLPRFVKAHARWMKVPIHRGVMCDATGMKPILGNRWHLKGQNYDLCQWAYDQLSDADKANYELIKEADNAAAAAGRGWHRRHHGHRGHPGGRHHGHHGHHGHPGSWRCAPDGASDETPAATHWGVSCDVSGMCPIVGNRWHKRGSNYDLCDAEYQKLDPAEQAKFVCIKHPRGAFPGGAAAAGFGFRRGPPHGFGFRRGPPPAFGGPPMMGAPSFGGPAGFGGPRSMFGGPPPFAHPAFGCRAKKAEPKRPEDAASAKFVKDLTVNDQSEKAPNEAFEKAWVLSAGKTGVPAGCSLVFIGGHHLNASELRVPVEGAPVAHGDEFVLRVNLRAPAEPGHYRSFWRLQTPAGRRFGPRIWADIMVAEPTTAAAAAAAAQQSQDKACASAPSMTFAEDITIPDGEQVLVGTKLRKTWLVSTATGWDAGCVLRCTDMWSSFAGMSEAVPAVPAGSQAEISITLTAPSKPGHYRSYWALADASGRQFGDQLFVEFNAVNELASGTQEAAPEQQQAEAASSNIDHDKAIEEALSEVTADAQAAAHQAAHEQAHAAAVEAAEAAAAAATAGPKPASSATGGGAAAGGANLDAAANKLANNLLQQILAGINVAPDSQNANLSDLLFRALSSNDFSAVLAELKKLNINISTE